MESTKEARNKQGHFLEEWWRSSIWKYHVATCVRQAQASQGRNAYPSACPLAPKGGAEAESLDKSAVVGPRGLEPRTSPLSEARSNHLS
jgi:hypothetical protein